MENYIPHCPNHPEVHFDVGCNFCNKCGKMLVLKPTTYKRYPSLYQLCNLVDSEDEAYVAYIKRNIIQVSLITPDPPDFIYLLTHTQLAEIGESNYALKKGPIHLNAGDMQDRMRRLWHEQQELVKWLNRHEYVVGTNAKFGVLSLES